jgi:hypothetical protein
MIQPIDQTRFRKLFPKPPPPPDSIAERLDLQLRETQWYEDRGRHKIGVVVYDRYDQDWQAIVLKKRKGAYRAYQLQHSLPTEKTAVGVLFQLFGLENEDFWQFMTEQNRLAMERTGKSLGTILREPRTSR